MRWWLVGLLACAPHPQRPDAMELAERAEHHGDAVALLTELLAREDLSPPQRAELLVRLGEACRERARQLRAWPHEGDDPQAWDAKAEAAFRTVLRDYPRSDPAGRAAAALAELDR